MNIILNTPASMRAPVFLCSMSVASIHDYYKRLPPNKIIRVKWNLTPSAHATVVLPHTHIPDINDTLPGLFGSTRRRGYSPIDLPSGCCVNFCRQLIGKRIVVIDKSNIDAGSSSLVLLIESVNLIRSKLDPL